MPRSPSLSSLSLSDLHREIARRGKQSAGLRKRRDALLKQVAALSAQIGDEPSMPAKGGPGRPRGSKNRKRGTVPARPRSENQTSLADALSAVLKGQTMSIAESIDAVRKAGYKSDSPNFRTMVNIALIKKDRFTRVSKGKYTAK